MKKIVFLTFLFILIKPLFAETGYELWLRYKSIEDKSVLDQYKKNLQSVFIEGESPTFSVIRTELKTALKGMLKEEPAFVSSINNATLVIAKGSSSLIRSLKMDEEIKKIGDEGFLITSKTINDKKNIYITGNTDAAILYGVFHFLRLMQTNQPLESIHVISFPKINLRLLNH